MINVNKNQTIKLLSLLKGHYENADSSELAKVETPENLEVGSPEWLYYICYSCLLDYGMRSSVYHYNLINTYLRFKELFSPCHIVSYYSGKEEDLSLILRENVHPRYPRIATKKWLKLSTKLMTISNLRRTIQSFESLDELENFIDSLDSYGQKTGNLLIRLIVDSKICKFEEAIRAIPLDRHDLEICYLSGITGSNSLTAKDIRELSTLLIETGRELEILPQDVDKYLWQIGNSFCSKSLCSECPLNVVCQTKKISTSCE